MKYRNLGSTNLELSRIGLGGNIFGFLLDKSEANRLIQSSFDQGINFIDTADVYSNGLSEEYIGSAVSGNRDKWILASKAGLENNQEPNGLGSKLSLKSRVEGSLKRLNTDYIDLYQLHHFDPLTPLEETLEAFSELIAEGKIRFAGCSNFNCDQLNQAIIRENNDLPGFSSLQTSFNMLKRDIVKEILPVCIEHEIGVIVYGILARGILTDKYLKSDPWDKNYTPRAFLSKSIFSDLTPAIQNLQKGLNDLAYTKLRLTLQSLALVWTLNQNGIDSAIIGIRTIHQITELANVVNIQLSKDIINEIDKIIGDLNEYRSLSLGNFINW